MQSGTYTVIPTFFDKNNQLDLESLKNHVLTLYDNFKLKKYVFLGTTSETPTLSLDEMKQIKDFVISFKKSDMTYVFGISGNDPKKVINDIHYLDYKDDNVDVIMISSPYYNKPNQRGLILYFSEILSTFNEKKFMLYNIPGRTSVNINPSTFKILEDLFENFVGIKEASGDIKQFMDLIEKLDRVKVFSGDDKLALPSYSVGSCGVISVYSNISSSVDTIWEKFSSNPLKSKEINQESNKFYDLLFIDSNPVPLKYILSRKYNKDSNKLVRSPLVELTDKDKETIDKILYLVEFDSV